MFKFDHTQQKLHHVNCVTTKNTSSAVFVSIFFLKVDVFYLYILRRWCLFFLVDCSLLRMIFVIDFDMFCIVICIRFGHGYPGCVKNWAYEILRMFPHCTHINLRECQCVFWQIQYTGYEQKIIMDRSLRIFNIDYL